MEYIQTDNPDYNQYWFYIKTPEYNIYPDDGSTKKTSKRIVAISTPKNLVPTKKYKYILNNDFNIDGSPSDWDCENNPYPKWGGIISGKCASDKNLLMKNTMDLFKKFIKQDYIMVHLSLTSEDVYYNQPCNDKNRNKKCWYLNNPDQQYLQNLFNLIYTNTFPKELSNLKISYDDLALFGYSVGAGAVSRYINDFPILKTSPDGYNFPTIKSAIMVAGGSLYCYSKIFSPCFDTDISFRGCCPSDMSEPNFDNKIISWSKHPPVILIQSTDDSYADPMASSYYYNIMVKNNVPVKKVIDDSTIHGINSENQINAIIDWVKQYFNPLIPVTPITPKPIIPTPPKKCIVNDNTGKKLKISSLIISLVIVIILFIVLVKEYESNKDKTIIAGILLFIVGVILIISLVFTLKNNNQPEKQPENPPPPGPTGPTGPTGPNQNIDSLNILQRQLQNIGPPTRVTAGELFDKIVEIKNQIYSDYPNIGGVLVHLAPLEGLEEIVQDKDFKFNLSSGGTGFMTDCSVVGQNKQNCSAWTYLRKDLPPIVYSYPSSPSNISMPYWNPGIGFIVDPSRLWPLITTMGIIDSATTGRNCGSQDPTYQFNIFDPGNDNGRCNAEVYTESGEKSTNQSEYCVFQSETTPVGCNTDCTYEKDIINTNCRMKNAGGSLNAYSWQDWGLSWDCPQKENRTKTDPNFPKGIPECYKAVEIKWADISDDDKAQLTTAGYGKNGSCKKWAKYIPSEKCYLTSPTVYQAQDTDYVGQIGAPIQGTNFEISNNDRNYFYAGASKNSNSGGATFSEQNWQNCTFKDSATPDSCVIYPGYTDNIPISTDNIITSQAKWLKKDWGRWTEEIIKMWKYIYSTLSKKDGYKNTTSSIDGNEDNYDYNYIYGNPCNQGDWWENEVNIYINDQMASDENSDLNKLFRSSMIGMLYIGKSCEDFTSELPTGTYVDNITPDGNTEKCYFSNSIERCVGYLCTNKVITKDPYTSRCDAPLTEGGKRGTYADVVAEEKARIERSKQAVISFVEKFNTKYRSGLNGIAGYKLMSSSNAFQSWACLDKLFKGKTTSADVFIPI